MAAAVLFGAVHALMPGHRKTVLVSYHLGQPAKLREGVANCAILAPTRVGLALVPVLAGFAVISRAFAYWRTHAAIRGRKWCADRGHRGVPTLALVRSDHHAHTKDGKTLAFVMGTIPCLLTTFIMSYALARGSSRRGSR